MCSPGTFLVANYLIINNGPFQVNFTKPKRATIRYTNSQWLREDATEASVGKVDVKKQVVNPTLIPSTVPISFPSPRDPAHRYFWGRVVVPKIGQKNASPRRDATEVPVGRVVVPKTGQKPPFATPGWLWSTCGHGGRAEEGSEAPFATP